MRIFVLVGVRSGDGAVPTCPPSVWHLQQCIRARSPPCYHATSGGHLWTRDALFRSLRRTHADAEAESGLKNAAPIPQRLFYFFSALLDVGDNEEDAEVVAMLLTELCVAWPGTIAAHMEVCRARCGDLPPVCASLPHANTSSSAQRATSCEAEGGEASWFARDTTREETLLVLLAREVEATANTQDSFFKRWGVHDAWDHIRALQGRSWWVNGGTVAVLPPEVNTRVVEPFITLELSRLTNACPPQSTDSRICRDGGLTLENALAHAILEKELTHRLMLYLRKEVEQRVEYRALHRMTVAVPPAMAVFLRDLSSSVLHECLLFHTVDCPLFAVGGGDSNAAQSVVERAIGVVAPAASTNVFVLPQKSSLSSTELQDMRYRVADEETSRLTELFREYDVLLSSGGYVRVPLAPVSRYVFTQLLCQTELPSALMSPFMRSHAHLTCAASDTAADSTRRCYPTEEEVVLGVKVTWAVGRWTAALQRGLGVMPLMSLPIWNQSRCLGRDQLCSWIQERMRAAKHEASLLFSVEKSAETNTKGKGVTHLTSTASVRSGDATDSPRHSRDAALGELEHRLFAPFPSSYHGSSTEWIGQALRDVAREQANAASSMVKCNDSPASAAGNDSASDEAVPPYGLDRDSCESSSDQTSDGGEDKIVGFGVPAMKEAETLLAQQTELEGLLYDELTSQSAGRQTRIADTLADYVSREDLNSAKVEAQGDVSSWLTLADMQHVARNELFLQHAELLESEMKHGI
ncbi:hypothetical protein JKF63_03000 [Porcisia hertigi]|uniref:Uncharacterized protein n=1 Tax=Porcisia hertigi TaxID=2761500 RepID=A0A836L6A4_9TRYP|nr:hypothetical protein JKF63_03000 [Porcisia hertigi]